MTQFRTAKGWICRTCGEFVEDDIPTEETFKDMICDNCDEEDSEDTDSDDSIYLVQTKCSICGVFMLGTLNERKEPVCSECKEKGVLK